MNNIVLSVIVPIYKVEAYLRRCIDSILQQDYEPMEIILVDDGSPDNCPQICDEYAKKDSRITVIHKPNGGLSSARNAGIEIAKGKYMVFVDSDDQWNNGLLRLLMDAVSKAVAIPLTFFSGVGLYSDGSVRKRSDGVFPFDDYRLMSRDDYYSMIISHGNLHESACTVVILKDFFIKNALFFKDKIIGEDTEWMFRCLRSVDKVAVYNIPLYLCTVGRPGSIQQTASTKSIMDAVSIIERSIDYYKIHIDDPAKEYELAHCSYLWSICLGLFNRVPKGDRKHVKQSLKALRRNINLKSHPKTNKIEVLYDFFGFSLTALILSLYIYLHQHNIVNRKKSIDG